MLSTIPPRENGGNIVYPNLTEGTTVYFPVFVKGALFSIGDAHAIQGLGEVCGTAIESPMTITYKLRVIKNKPAIKEPQYETDDYYAVTGFGETIDLATKKAVNYMIDHLTNNYDITAEDAYMLCSLVGDLHIAEVVDVPNMLVTMHFPKSIINQL
jgi:Predicted acetamidase/formamidase